MTELQSELTFIRFLRAGILLAALIVVPATAVCWNMIPKDFLGEDQYNPPTSPHDQAIYIPPTLEKSENLHADNESDTELPTTSSLSFPPSPVFFQEPYQEPYKSKPRQSPNRQSNSYESKPQAMIPEQNASIKTMGGTDERTWEQPIPNSFHINNKSAIVLAAESSERIRRVNYSVDHRTTAAGLQQSFPVLENQLKQLGAKYYRLEKWGSRGELFRFSCYVSSSEPYQYQKYFQAIDSDELRVMESVIEEIKRWKK
ncbi:MAG: hypothetical protein LBG58_11670 [Planctomycetaceae bacterium]|nr:hypothetical protein [Planctomycetaceae bacterium]